MRYLVIFGIIFIFFGYGTWYLTYYGYGLADEELKNQTASLRSGSQGGIYGVGSVK